MIGLGLVGTTILEMMNITPIGRSLVKQYKSMVIIDMEDKSKEPTVLDLMDSKVKIELVTCQITQNNIQDKLLKYIGKKDLVIDVSYNIYFKPIMCRCFSVGAYYINTSLERWELQDENLLDTEFIQRTLHENNIEAKKLKCQNAKSSILLNHGMNPGLISHFGILGLVTVAHRLLDEAEKATIDNDLVKQIKSALKSKNYPLLGYLLDLRVLHCSENDTQIPIKPREPGEFVNSWSSYSFYSEGCDPVQLGWGTQEVDYKTLPGAVLSSGEPNQIYLPIRGIDMVARSYTYDREIVGMLVSHSENDTLCQLLTLRDPKTGQVIHRPSAYYVYNPAQCAIESLSEVRKSGYFMTPKKRQLRATEIQSGEDAVGSLLIFGSHPIQRIVYNRTTPPSSFWSGTILSIEDTKQMGFRYSGPTPVQVGISVLSAIKYMKKHKPMGVIFPENLPFDKILDECYPFLGKIFLDFVPFEIDSTQFAGQPGYLTHKNSSMPNRTCIIL